MPCGAFCARTASSCGVSFPVSTDPQFAAKAADIVGLYLDPPLNALVVCVDEKPSIQALQRKTDYVFWIFQSMGVQFALFWRRAVRLLRPAPWRLITRRGRTGSHWSALLDVFPFRCILVFTRKSGHVTG